jgi:hypothetical protein
MLTMAEAMLRGFHVANFIIWALLLIALIPSMVETFRPRHAGAAIVVLGLVCIAIGCTALYADLVYLYFGEGLLSEPGSVRTHLVMRYVYNIGLVTGGAVLFASRFRHRAGFWGFAAITIAAGAVIMVTASAVQVHPLVEQTFP